MATAAMPLWLRRLRALQRKLVSRPPPSLHGAVDRVLPNEVIGWTWDRAQPSTRLLVEASAGGIVLGRALADLPRRDLVAEGVGDGRHGFRIRLDKPSPSNKIMLVEVVKGRRRTRLQVGAKAYLLASETPSAKAKPSRAPLASSKPKTPSVGFLDRVNGQNLEGWAVNPLQNGPTTVDLFDDEIYLGSVLASLERPRLQETGAPAGARGFSFDLTPVYNAGLLQRLRARVAGTTYDLRRGLQFPTVAEVLEHALRVPSAFDAAPAKSDYIQNTHAPILPAPREQQWLGLLCGGENIQALSPSGPDQKRMLTINDGGALTDLLVRADFVLFAAADARPAWVSLASIENRFPSASVFVEGAADQNQMASEIAGARAALDLAAWGRAPGVFAISGSALARVRDVQPAELIGAGWEAVARRLADLPRLKWCSTSPGDLIEAGQSPARIPVASCGPGAPMPTRVSLAVREGWTDKPPPALIALIENCAGMHVEVLAPQRADASIVEADLRKHAISLASLTYRQVDGFAVGEFWSGLRASAAQVLLIAAVTLDGVEPSDVQRLCAWAVRPGVGFVSIDAADLPEDSDSPPNETNGLLALSRQALAELDIDLSGRLDGHESEFESLLLKRGRLPLHLPKRADVATSQSEQAGWRQRG